MPRPIAAPRLRPERTRQPNTRSPIASMAIGTAMSRPAAPNSAT